MPQDQEQSSREKVLGTIARLLKTPDGEILMEELRIMWDLPTLLGDTPEFTAHNVGQRDAYYYLQWLRDNE